MSVEATDDVSGEVADNVSVEEAGADHESSQAVDPTVPAVDPTVPLAILDPHAAAAAQWAEGSGKCSQTIAWCWEKARQPPDPEDEPFNNETPEQRASVPKYDCHVCESFLT